MDAPSSERARIRMARSAVKQKNQAPNRAKIVAPKKAKGSKKIASTSAVVMLKAPAFRRFEKWMKEPGEPTEAIRRGAALLQSHYPKGR